MAMIASALRLGPLRSRARDLLEPSAIPNPKKPNDAVRQLHMIRRLAKQNGTLQRVFRTQRREFPTDTRKTDLHNQVYFRKWHHLKYCTQMIQYSDRNGLRLRDDVESESACAQKPWAENLKTPFQGSGRLREDELGDANKGGLDRDSVDRAGTWRENRAVDKGFSREQLLKLARS
ncbi:unnamed protein product [Polarella glacialis]|uniref:Uncharacterized protein n=1 Tax=Polarella glacialis TaxID=89957 RepID=A0A813GLJ0_POLGL|nr:unnamed protein product [Polarella glacialis]CAE8722407.1 unnamed protein product [Polarella glacialis]|mmetsp:Transcript_10111/g.18406  ORF Transcript_10111/g.18406 Transcript_10111/m.18406 type:complete len:176 (-) Transcript_10111:69-596(-)